MAVKPITRKLSQAIPKARPILKKLGRASLSSLPILGTFATGIAAYHIHPVFQAEVDRGREFLLAHNPHTIEVLASATLLATSDIIAQRYEGNSFSYSRLGRMFVFGGLSGFFARQFYDLLDQMYPPENGRQIVKRVLIDQGNYAPLFLASFHTFNHVLQGKPITELAGSIRKFVFKFIPLSWSFWTPGATLIYCLPDDLKVYTSAILGLVWGIVLSRIGHDLPRE
ncbi:MAG: Mpv17/PMP22 family protein [Candidatus Margulisbacteria bacterium]|nr:Mpv17/PMP22 family protein [Candidatus Margulisiibacteriota bacterium]MBU1021582.1 Mpv17/PMP22 family protein [Candidatus Margulisiibacteriota bacterium]MBU1728733.1 Mpv17/PMP22 family protein [Candidatus Margulisiibacteriota bacterium]MBU1955184.1 Mpv17/PMP22 family protein [Candidatus Margulisiibacteriota bacterium]